MTVCNERICSIRKYKRQKHQKLTIPAEEWLGNVRLTRQQSTYVKYKQVYIKYIKKAIESKRVSDISSPGMQRKLIEEITAQAMSESTLNSIYSVIKQIAKYADIEFVAKIPERKHAVSMRRKQRVKTLSLEEQGRLIAVLEDRKDVFGKAVMFSLNTGLRIGEVCSLKWADIDLSNRVFSVNRTVQRLPADDGVFRTRLVENAPKSEKSKRSIPLNDYTYTLLIGLYHAGEYVFGEDSPMDPRTLQYKFKRIITEAGISDINFHALRHTFATNCIECGMDTKTLSELLGHSNVRITLDRYVHPSMDAKRRSMNDLETFFAQISGR